MRAQLDAVAAACRAAFEAGAPPERVLGEIGDVCADFGTTRLVEVSRELRCFVGNECAVEEGDEDDDDPYCLTCGEPMVCPDCDEDDEDEDDD